jgi:hypothetical protein
MMMSETCYECCNGKYKCRCEKAGYKTYSEAELQAIQAELEERFNQRLEARLLEQREACADIYDQQSLDTGVVKQEVFENIRNATIEEG